MGGQNARRRLPSWARARFCTCSTGAVRRRRHALLVRAAQAAAVASTSCRASPRSSRPRAARTFQQRMCYLQCPSLARPLLQSMVLRALRPRHAALRSSRIIRPTAAITPTLRRLLPSTAPATLMARVVEEGVCVSTLPRSNRPEALQHSRRRPLRRRPARRCAPRRVQSARCHSLKARLSPHRPRRSRSNRNSSSITLPSTSHSSRRPCAYRAYRCSRAAPYAARRHDTTTAAARRPQRACRPLATRPVRRAQEEGARIARP